MATVFLYSFCAALVVQLFFYWFFYSRIAFHRSKIKIDNVEFPPLSVIISARNEQENLEKYLPIVLEQSYPNFEVVVVDDCSIDATIDVLRTMKKRYPERLHVTQVKPSRGFDSSKKFALTMGIKAARYENLVFTDADCYPTSNQWLKYLGGALNKRPMVLGYGGMIKEKGLLNALIRFETAVIGMQYLALAKAGLPYMGVGRNLAYKAHLYHKQKGFSKHLHLKSGDDDLMVNAASDSKNTSIALNEFCITKTPAKSTFRKWIIQKKRHLTTASRYKWKHKFILTLLPLSQMIFSVSFITLLFFPEWRLYALMGLLIRLLTQLLIWFYSFKQLDEKHLFWLGPIFELFFMVFYPYLAMSNTIDRFNEWKKKR